jgi:hypothetical protein
MRGRTAQLIVVILALTNVKDSDSNEELLESIFSV